MVGHRFGSSATDRRRDRRVCATGRALWHRGAAQAQAERRLLEPTRRRQSRASSWRTQLDGSCLKLQGSSRGNSSCSRSAQAVLLAPLPQRRPDLQRWRSLPGARDAGRVACRRDRLIGTPLPPHRDPTRDAHPRKAHALGSGGRPWQEHRDAGESCARPANNLGELGRWVRTDASTVLYAPRTLKLRTSRQKARGSLRSAPGTTGGSPYNTVRRYEMRSE